MLNTADRISYKQRMILIHSYIYYNLDRNIMSDTKYDKLSYNLVDLIKQHPEEFRQSEYASIFETFDGNSGFGLYEALTDEQKARIQQIAGYLCRSRVTKKK